MKIKNGEIEGTVIELGTIGFTNGCVRVVTVEYQEKQLLTLCHCVIG